jgi:hypothetical protein
MGLITDGTLADLVGDSLAPFVDEEVVLIKVTTGARGPIASAGTTTTETSHVVAGWIASFDAREVAALAERGTIVRARDARISILGSTLPAGVTPAPADKITLGGVTYRIVGDAGSQGGGLGVQTDAARAVYVCHVRA